MYSVDVINKNITELLDYCDDDVFEAQCSSGMVVLVEEARYGRMGLGTCLKRDFGFIDCYRLVLLDTHSNGVFLILQF